MVNLAEIISKLWNTYQRSTWELTAFIRDTQKANIEVSQDHGQLAEKIRKVRQGESVENEKTDKPYFIFKLDEKAADELVALMGERTEMIDKYPYILMSMAFIYLVALFDSFLTDVFAAVLIERPETLKSKKQLTYDRILELHQKGELVEFMARREINELSYKSMADQFDYYKAKFNIDLADSNVELAALVEIRARRNLLVHNNGVVDEIYMEAIKHTTYNLGEHVEITFDYWNECKERQNSVATFVHKSVLEKFVKENRKDTLIDSSSSGENLLDSQEP